MSEMAQSAAGIQVLRGSTLIGEIADVNQPGYTVGKNDSSSHDNLGCIESSVPGWISKTDGTIKINYYGSTVQDALWTALLAKTISQWTICMPQRSTALKGKSYVFNGYIGGIKPAYPMRGNVQWDITIVPTDLITPVSTWADGLTTPFLSIADDDSNALTPTETPAQATYEYNVQCYSDNTSFTITPTATTGTIYVNGVVVVSGAASSAITAPSASGEAVYASIVVLETNKTPKIYLIRVVKGWSVHP